MSDDPRLAGLDTPLRPPERRTTSVAPPPPPAVMPEPQAPVVAPQPTPAAAPRSARPRPATKPASTTGGRVAASLPPELDEAFRQRAIDDDTTQGEVLLAALDAHGADVVANPPKKPRKTGDAVLRTVFLSASGMAVVEALMAMAPADRLNRSLLIRHCLQRYLLP